MIDTMLNLEKQNQIKQFIKTYLSGGMSQYSLNEMVGRYNREKKREHLANLFGDKLIIEKEIDLQKDAREVLRDVMRSGIIAEIVEAIADSLTEKGVWSALSAEERVGFESRIFTPGALVDNKVQNDFHFTSDYFNGLKLQKGTKLTKIFKTFISNKAKVHELQTKISQLHNTKTFKGTLCLSIDPIDYLTASLNDEGWSSCYHPDGQFRASTLMLLESPNTMVAYLKSSTDMNLIPAGFSWNSKRWRVFVTLNKDLKKVHVGQQYPYNSKILKNETVKMIQELTGEVYSNHTCGCSDFSMYIETPYAMYNDAEEGAIQVFYAEDASPSMDCVYISNGGTCPDCGEFFDEAAEGSAVCYDCRSVDYCSHCDAYCEDLIVVGDDGHVCPECAEEWSECVVCGDTKHYHCGQVDEGGDFYCNQCIARDPELSSCGYCCTIVATNTLVPEIYGFRQSKLIQDETGGPGEYKFTTVFGTGYQMICESCQYLKTREIEDELLGLS